MVTGTRMRVRARDRVTGSVLDDVLGAMPGAETTLVIDSPADPRQWPGSFDINNGAPGCS